MHFRNESDPGSVFPWLQDCIGEKIWDFPDDPNCQKKVVKKAKNLSKNFRKVYNQEYVVSHIFETGHFAYLSKESLFEKLKHFVLLSSEKFGDFRTGKIRLSKRNGGMSSKEIEIHNSKNFQKVFYIDFLGVHDDEIMENVPKFFRHFRRLTDF